MHFGEYELSPSLISLSPLPSAHPEAFQRHTSAWPRVDHSVSRLLLPTKRPFQTRFRFGYRLEDP